MFRRRDSRPPHRFLWEFLYPRGGWWRATSYIWLRLQRLPDDPRRIARGIAAGTFISFTPLFGFHFLGAAGIAWLIRGNILAALIATFVGNPLTTPLLAALSLETGYRILGARYAIPIAEIPAAFSKATGELGHNIIAIFSAAPTRWGSLGDFTREVFLPYLVGGTIWGVTFALAFYFAALPLIRAYQAHQRRKAEDRIARARARAEAFSAALAARQAAEAAEAAPSARADGGPGLR